jgi:hypothetical protein
MLVVNERQLVDRALQLTRQRYGWHGLPIEPPTISDVENDCAHHRPPGALCTDPADGCAL